MKIIEKLRRLINDPPPLECETIPVAHEVLTALLDVAEAADDLRRAQEYTITAPWDRVSQEFADTNLRQRRSALDDALKRLKEV